MSKVKNFNGVSVITVEDLFQKLEGYLIPDIQFMLGMEDSKSRGIGYPCLMTILSGMELLGILVSGDCNCGFNEFWNIFQEKNDKYKSNDLRRLFRGVIRNGIAHHYLPKSGIYVHYGKPKEHLHEVEINGIKGLFISCTALFNDFFYVYLEIKNDLLEHPNKAFMKELNENINVGQKLVDKYLESEDFKRIDDGSVLTEINLAGASGFGPSSGDSFYPGEISA